MSDGRTRAVIVRPDGSFASLENPAQRREIVRMFVTGIGSASPAIWTNQIGIPNVEANAVVTMTVLVNNERILPVSVTYARNMFGVYEVAFEIPKGAPGAPDIVTVPLVLSVSGSQLQLAAFSSIAIQ